MTKISDLYTLLYVDLLLIVSHQLVPSVTTKMSANTTDSCRAE